MIEIKNNLYQTVPLEINGTVHNIQAKGSIVLNMNITDLPSSLRTIDKDMISIKEIQKEQVQETVVSKKKKETLQENVSNA